MNPNMSTATLEILRPMAAAVLAKLGVEETEESMVSMADFILQAVPVIRAEEDKNNHCQATIKSGEKKGQVCGKLLKDGACTLHKEAVKEEFTPCDMILKSGEKKGQVCGKKCAANETKCAIHLRVETPGNGCTYVFNKGDKKGDSCDKKRQGDSAFCTFHTAAHNKSESRSNEKAAEAAEGPSEKPKKVKAPKEESDSKEEAKEPEPIRCVRRAGKLVIKETVLAIDADATEIIGFVKQTDEEWVFHAEFHESMTEAKVKYGLKCEYKAPEVSRMMVEEE